MAKRPIEIGKVLVSVQDELRSLKTTLGSLESDQAPQIEYLKTQIHKIENDLDSKAESVLHNIMTNGGVTAQELPRARAPSRRGPLGMAGGFVTTQATLNMKPNKQGYVRKQNAAFYSYQKRASAEDYANPTITEDEISKGMLNLINKGKIPKDVDLTPAFERGAPPIISQAVTLHRPDNRHQRVVPAIGEPEHQAIRYDLETAFDATSVGRNSIVAKALPSTVDLLMDEKPLALPAPPPPQPFGYDQRDYNELLDQFSSHHFYIRKGTVMHETPEFISYMRILEFKWHWISKAIAVLEDLLTMYEVPMAEIDGKMLAMCVEEEQTTMIDLAACVVNKDEVFPLIKIPQIRFQGTNGRILAAIAIQSAWRCHIAYTAYTQLKHLIRNAKVIQRFVRKLLTIKRTHREAARAFRDKLAQWNSLQEKFKANWETIKRGKRVIIHLCSHSVDEARRITMHKFNSRENIQMNRLFGLKDPNVSIIYLAPIEINEEIVNFYTKMLEFGDIEDAASRFVIITPDSNKQLPGHISTTKAVLYSTRVLKRLKALVKFKQAYIIPSAVSKEEIELSLLLGVPLLSGDPYKSGLFSTKSGCRRIFTSSDVPIPPGAYDIYDEREFLTTLTRLISNNLHVNTWIFKIDNEFNGRGTAWLDVTQLKIVMEYRKKDVELSEVQQNKIYEILNKVISRNVRFAMPSLYPSWAHFMREYSKVGGVIEAAPFCQQSQVNSPSVAFCIEPSGEISLIGAFDKIKAREFVNAGYIFPQTSLTNLNLTMISNAIGEVLYEKGILGHVTIDLVSFPDDTGTAGHPLFWAVDINCNLSDAASICTFFDFLMEGTLDPVSGNYEVDVNNAEFTKRRARVEKQSSVSIATPHSSKYSASSRASSRQSLRPSKGPTPAPQLAKPRGPDMTKSRGFIFIPFLHHPGLANIQYKTFFHMCRVEGISFDLEARVGTTFLLCDSLQSGVLSVISMGRHLRETLSYLSETLTFIQNQGGMLPPPSSQLIESRSDDINAAEIISRVKLLSKNVEKKRARNSKPFQLELT